MDIHNMKIIQKNCYDMDLYDIESRSQRGGSIESDVDSDDELGWWSGELCPPSSRLTTFLNPLVTCRFFFIKPLDLNEVYVWWCVDCGATHLQVFRRQT